MPKFQPCRPINALRLVKRLLHNILDIFYRMGFTVEESRELDDDWHMFTSLNFPEGHPARDDYDTFVTKETDKNGNHLIAPAHTSTMQNRVLQKFKENLAAGKPIAVLLPGRVFRNEDLDARHEHTFYQFEGVYIDKGIHAGHLMATFQTFLSEYFKQDIEIKSQPFYFPFTEPSFELALSCPFCQKKGCHICSHTGWIELLGMGMIHPNVLKMAGINPSEYTGFAWGCGIERLVMMKYNIEDIRHFESGKLDFLRQFAWGQNEEGRIMNVEEKMKIKKFTDLKVWQASRMLIKNTYRACVLLPASEQFGLISQMKRASVSIFLTLPEAS